MREEDKNPQTSFRNNERWILKEEIRAEQVCNNQLREFIISANDKIIIVSGEYPSQTHYVFTREAEVALKTPDGDKVLWTVSKEILNKQKGL